MTDDLKSKAERAAEELWPGDIDVEMNVMHARARATYVRGYLAHAKEVDALDEALDTAIFLIERGNDLSVSEWCSMKDRVTKVLARYRGGAK